jgi:hypothetical protein
MNGKKGQMKNKFRKVPGLPLPKHPFSLFKYVDKFDIKIK